MAGGRRHGSAVGGKSFVQAALEDFAVGAVRAPQVEQQQAVARLSQEPVQVFRRDVAHAASIARLAVRLALPLAPR